MIVYSIIIPHYNVPDLLRRCIWSIPKRDDVEIIVVDDCSETLYAEQLKKLQQAYPEVKIIWNRENNGPGVCRNIALEQAKGKMIIFADADDYFSYCFNAILDEYIDTPHDVVYFNASSVDNDTYVNAERALPFNQIFECYAKDKELALYQLKYVLGGPVCKIIKRGLLEANDIRFEHYLIHEDTRFSYLIGYYAQSIGVDPRAMYCITCRTGSITSVVDEERLLTKVKVFLEKEKFLKEHFLPTDDCKLHYYGLIEAYERADHELYEKVIRLFEQYGHSRREVEKYVADYKQRKRNSQHKQIYARVLNRCVRWLRK